MLVPPILASETKTEGEHIELNYHDLKMLELSQLNFALNGDRWNVLVVSMSRISPFPRWLVGKAPRTAWNGLLG